MAMTPALLTRTCRGSFQLCEFSNRRQIGQIQPTNAQAGFGHHPLQLRDSPFGLVRAAGCNRHSRACCGESAARLQSDARRATGHNDIPAGEIDTFKYGGGRR
jgi:hypothetical protein